MHELANQPQVIRSERSHLIYNELTGSGISTQDVRGWIEPINKKVKAIKVKRTSDGFAMYCLEGDDLPEILVAMKFTTPQKAVSIVNDWLGGLNGWNND